MKDNLLYSFKDRYHYLLEKDGTYKNDLERETFFYIIAGNMDLYKKIAFIYDFEERMIKPECLESEEVDFCSSSKALIRLAFNLYNGFVSSRSDIFHIFYNLDEDNFNLALDAIKLRFNK